MSNRNILPGQRWISNAQSDLGLGTVLKTEGRSFTLFFPACGEMRTYAIDNAPLTRVRFAPGDQITDHCERQIQVTEVEEQEGILCYHGVLESGQAVSIQEGELSDWLRIANPRQRLLTGRLDHNRWFELRRQTLEHRRYIERSPVRGLVGARIDLLRHQLYIADEVSRRHQPRVLLADEVGLGKTIEAGLILHRLLHTERVSRVLILVPDSLIHQWLVELLRRFNLKFSILDESRCAAITESGQGDNPFHAEQWVLSPLGLFAHNSRRCQQVLEGNWDLLIVDEAHHLEWTPEVASESYQLVEGLAQTTPGVLLLTATPEQLGKAGHFARMRLLDPDRFHDLESFRHEEEQYRPVALAIDRLLRGEALTSEEARQLLAGVGESGELPDLEALTDPESSEAQRTTARDHLVALLLDRHGTGRVLFRNTRTHIQGFPPREIHPQALPLPAEYHALLAEGEQPPELRLAPERLYRETIRTPAWSQFDPRIGYLTELLRRLVGTKLLLICSSAETASDLCELLRQRAGIPAALFHEGMTIIERDRAAAWFADPEAGAQILVCSEIGSEGRNFQFAHHLVLFDLPFNADLLEQRIGRLDRIGQRHTIQIHIPYFATSAQEVLLRWYQESLDALSHPCTVGRTLQHRLLPQLLQALAAPQQQAAVNGLLEQAQQLRLELNAALLQGRDHLLELNSCRPQVATMLVNEVQAEDDLNRSLHAGLPGYLDRLLTLYGVESEEHSLGTWIFRPGSHMVLEHFPGIPEDGITGTYHRDTALTHEDRQFLTWEHPLVRDSMALLLDDERGTTTAATLKHPAVRGGRLLLEFLFSLECIAPRRLQAGRFLPPTLIHKIIDQDGQEVSGLLVEQNYKIKSLEPNIAGRIIRSLEGRINEIFKSAETIAAAGIALRIGQARDQMAKEYQLEIERLTALAEVNPNVRQEEIQALHQEAEQLHEVLGGAELRLDSVRMLIST